MLATGRRFAIVVVLLLCGLCFAAAAAPEAFAGSKRSETSVECSLVRGVTCKVAAAVGSSGERLTGLS
jgi:hypothetical protein